MTSALSKMVTRYSNWCAVTHGHEMMAKPDGSWVLFADYQIAIAELLTARLEIERLRAALDEAIEFIAQDWRGLAENMRREHLSAETPVKHAFVGDGMRDCETCGSGYRDPIHGVSHE